MMRKITVKKSNPYRLSFISQRTITGYIDKRKNTMIRLNGIIIVLKSIIAIVIDTQHIKYINSESKSVPWKYATDKAKIPYNISINGYEIEILLLQEEHLPLKIMYPTMGIR